jgi:hypothetical protein
MRIDSAGTVWQVAYFRDVPIGAQFHCNGNRWMKRSSRTAVMVKPDSYAGIWFYFRGRDLCEKAYRH